MATPELAIAKATLSATLFRADPTSLSRPSVETFFPLLTSALAQCSRPNVQKCKAWIVDNISPSNARTVALAKYLGALSKSFSQSDNEKPSAKRRRLHILYVLNDVLYHVVKRKGQGQFATAWEGVLPILVANAAAFQNCPKHEKKLENLIVLWEEKRYFNQDVLSKLRDALANGSTFTEMTDSKPATSVKLSKDAPYILPSLHGDPSAPWYDLPATTWLPHFTPNSTKPMIPDLIKPIHLASGPADKVLADAVRNLLSDVEQLFSKEQKLDNDVHADFNELGERVLLDEITGEIVGGETYYGWSRGFCEKMKKRGKKNARGEDRGRSRSRSSSRSRGRSGGSSPPAFKRRKFSVDSKSRSRSRSRSPDRNHRRSQSYSRSRSRSPDRRYARPSNRRSYSRSPSRSRSRSPHRHHRRSPPPISNRPHRPVPDHRPPPHQQPFPPHPNYPPVPPPVNFPVPPPPPTGYPGPWPPPPPPPPMTGGWIPTPGMTPPQMMGGWSHLPPPPPPHGPPQNGFGRGNGGGYRGRGRGGYNGGGRGGW